MVTKIILEARSLTKRFGGLIALDNVNIRVEKGKITALIGPNGAGKTTFINVATGFLPPDSGSIWFEERNITGFNPAKTAEHGLIRTFQDVRPLEGLTLLENVMMGRLRVTKNVAKAKRGALEILESMNMRGSDRPVDKLTAAEIRLLGLARAVAADPTVLLIDEVVAGLNPREVDEVLEILRRLKERGITMLLVEHVMRAVMSISDRVIVLDRGRKIAEGKPLEVTRNKEVIEAYLGVEA